MNPTFLLLFAFTTLTFAQGVDLTYLANQGVLLSDGETSVIIDGLYRKPDNDMYAKLSSETRQLLEEAAPPYDQIELVLVTHKHADHFGPGVVGNHLLNNPDAMMITTRQVQNEFRAKFKEADKVIAKALAFTPSQNRSEGLKPNGIPLRVLNLPHGGPQRDSIQNNGYLVTLGERKILHIGDAVLTEDVYKPHDLLKEDIDIAIFGFWLLDAKGMEVIRKTINPKLIVAAHIPPKQAARVREALSALDPDILVLTQRNETYLDL